MANNTGKENIADGLVAGPVFTKAPSLSPRKSSRKMRSKSIGPGGLDALEEHALKESSGNRRKSAFIPAVKSILASNDEDEKKRRRKSLGAMRRNAMSRRDYADYRNSKKTRLLCARSYAAHLGCCRISARCDNLLSILRSYAPRIVAFSAVDKHIART